MVLAANHCVYISWVVTLLISVDCRWLQALRRFGDGHRQSKGVVGQSCDFLKLENIP